MCLGAIYWARFDALYFANTKQDAAAIHFDDQFIYQELSKELKDRKLPTYRLDNTQAIKVFEEWARKEDKIAY
jgi:tRNA(Arg) A34 adenosine deaminase TadA